MSENPGSLQHQIETLGATMQRGFDKLEQAIAAVDLRLRNLEQNEAGCRGVQELKLTACDRAISELKAEVNEVQGQVKALEKELPVIRAVKWIAAVLGVSVIALIWSLITGQAQLLIK